MSDTPRGVILTLEPHPISKEHTMRTVRTVGGLEHQPASVRAKLAAAWTSFMFLYIYVDYLVLYKPGVIEDILNGVVWKLDITQTWAVGALTLVAIPISMVLASTTLPARACRIITLGVASLYVPVSIFNVVDESWTYYFALGAALEVAVLALIIRTAWNWPRTPRAFPDSAVEASRPLRTARTS
jgi:hypothetical protein